MLEDIIKIFYPDLCINCGCILHKKENILCLVCRVEVPIAIHDYTNQISNLFFGRNEIKNIVSFLYFDKAGIVQKMIHHLKYKNRQDIGVFIGHWFCSVISEKEVFSNVDYIVPVPIHKKKLKNRGYNQLTTFGQTLSSVLDVPYFPNSLICIKDSNSQTKKNRYDRFSKNNKVFELINLDVFENKHVLLVDDIVTTGATLLSCIRALEVTKNINISIATIAFTVND